MLKVGWFCPVSSRTGIAAYARNVLRELQAQFGPDALDLTICHPPTDDDILDMCYPLTEITEDFLSRDFASGFDVIVYHLGNNDQHHGPIYAALMQVPGVVVLHDFVYQHYLAGLSYDGAHISPAYSALVQAASGARAFEVLAASGILKCDTGKVPFVPWESEWSVQNPIGDVLARLGSGAVVHSDYARRALGDGYPGTLTKLFMPRPGGPPPAPISIGERVHIVAGGHIQATKGLTLLVGAFAQEPELAAHFDVTVAGFGTDKRLLEQLRSEVSLAGLKSTIRFQIDPTEAEFMEVMRSADIFFNLRFPNTEGASLSLAEQLSLGRPAILYRTGSFAEVPEDSCYFLDRIGDVTELATLLGDIAENPGDVAARGMNARRAVEGATAAAYAKHLFAFLDENRDIHTRRRSLTAFRQTHRLPTIAPQDAAWFTALARARQVMRGYYDRTFALPANVFDGDDLDIGRFVSLGLLETRGRRPQLQRLGRYLRDLPRPEAVEVIGLLIHLASLADASPDNHLPRYLAHFPSVQENATLWRCLCRLEPSRAVDLGLVALHVTLSDDLRQETAARAQVLGFSTAILQFLKGRTVAPTEAPALARITAILHEAASEGQDTLLPSRLGHDLVPDWRQNDPVEPRVLLQNFHRVENIGCWTSAPAAQLFLRVPDGTVCQSCTGRIMFIPAPGKAPYQIAISVEEIAGNRRTVFNHNVAPGGRNPFEFYMNLDRFTGTLRIGIATPSVHCPADHDPSADPRELGAMLQQLILWPTPLKQPA